MFKKITEVAPKFGNYKDSIRTEAKEYIKQGFYWIRRQCILPQGGKQKASLFFPSGSTDPLCVTSQTWCFGQGYLG